MQKKHNKSLHTDLGHRTRGAKVDGHIVPLKYKLQNGQRVEILTTKQGAPSRDWLSPQLGYLKSTRARAKVRHWFKTQNMADLQGLQSISMDMWDPFIKAVRENITDADTIIAFDRYHVAQYFNKAVDKVRASENNELKEKYGESVLARTKYDWLRNSDRTDNRTGNRPSFLHLTLMNLKTARAWRIKEAASKLWGYEYMGVALKEWKKLLYWISHCRLQPVIKVGEMIRTYFWGIENAIRLKANNAMLESKNNGIQRIKKIACGFRNRERFRMAILFHFGGLDFGFSPPR